jgi:NTP pyrophosphatase (non-canonical NTP hydrolase)
MAKDLPEKLNLATLGLGIAGEAGEVADIIKKIVGHGHPLDVPTKDKLNKELGDVLWYVATLCYALNLQMEDVAEANIYKLRTRYPEGFSTERSMNRNDQ